MHYSSFYIPHGFGRAREEGGEVGLGQERRQQAPDAVWGIGGSFRWAPNLSMVFAVCLPWAFCCLLHGGTLCCHTWQCGYRRSVDRIACRYFFPWLGDPLKTAFFQNTTVGGRDQVCSTAARMASSFSLQSDSDPKSLPSAAAAGMAPQLPLGCHAPLTFPLNLNLRYGFQEGREGREVVSSTRCTKDASTDQYLSHQLNGHWCEVAQVKTPFMCRPPRHFSLCTNAAAKKNAVTSSSPTLRGSDRDCWFSTIAARMVPLPSSGCCLATWPCAAPYISPNLKLWCFQEGREGREVTAHSTGCCLGVLSAGPSPLLLARVVPYGLCCKVPRVTVPRKLMPTHLPSVTSKRSLVRRDQVCTPAAYITSCSPSLQSDSDPECWALVLPAWRLNFLSAAMHPLHFPPISISGRLSGGKGG